MNYKKGDKFVFFGKVGDVIKVYEQNGFYKIWVKWIYGKFDISTFEFIY